MSASNVYALDLTADGVSASLQAAVGPLPSGCSLGGEEWGVDEDGLYFDPDGAAPGELALVFLDEDALFAVSASDPDARSL